MSHFRHTNHKNFHTTGKGATFASEGKTKPDFKLKYTKKKAVVMMASFFTNYVKHFVTLLLASGEYVSQTGIPLKSLPCRS